MGGAANISKKNFREPGVVIQACDPCPLEAEALQDSSEFKVSFCNSVSAGASQGYRASSCLKRSLPGIYLN